MASDLTSLIASEATLLQEAALALPHSFDKCTYSLGPLRQAVHLCLTCAVPRGLCSACSIACHGDHEQIELFPKRAFVCDCPTRVGENDCTLHTGVVAENSGNIYGQNFEGKFCRCGRSYDVKRERETMVQCLACEDWFHESCLNLRTCPTERPPSPDPPTAAVNDNTDVDSTASNDLPQPLLPSSTYETLICGKCVLSNDTLQRWAGTRGIKMVVKCSGTDGVPQVEDGGIDPRWKVLEEAEDEVEEVDVVSEGKAMKRPLEMNGDGAHGGERPVKKLRADDGSDLPVYSSAVPAAQALNASPCLAPRPHPHAQRVFDILRARKHQMESNSTKLDENIGEGDIFLEEGWRDRWCRCPTCLPTLESHPHLLEEEEIYEPPKDPDSATSLEELGLRALQNLPRDRAIDGIHAYNTMRDELIAYLRPFALEGTVVREQDVRDFFDAKAQERG